jgi:site-specific DNA-methyltransferase (adenine-specific)
VDKLQGKDVPVYKGFNVAGQGIGLNENKNLRSDHPEYIKPNYDNEWEGWGTALKPAHEPIVMARKPLSEKSVAENVLRWGTGGINIDESRIGTDDVLGREQKSSHEYAMLQGGYNDGYWDNTKGLGRWPANIIFDEEAGQVLDQQSGVSTGKVGMTQQSSPNNIYNGFKSTGDTKVNDGKTDKGGASRFYYCPKASKKDRTNDGVVNNTHATVKPTALMLYLIKLVTPVNGTVLDCFLGSGSTGKAAIRGGFDFIGIEREEEYIKIAEARIKNEMNG